jgi:hypothetical protein
MKAKPTGNAQEDWFEDEEDGFMAEKRYPPKFRKTYPPELRRGNRKLVSLPVASATRQ